MLSQYFVTVDAVDGELRERESYPFHVVIVCLANNIVVDILKCLQLPSVGHVTTATNASNFPKPFIARALSAILSKSSAVIPARVF